MKTPKPNIFFKKEWIDKTIIPLIPQNFINRWDIDFYNHKHGYADKVRGGIRINGEQIEEFYLYVTTIDKTRSNILKFNNTKFGYKFDSLYTGYDLYKIGKWNEYRYDVNNKILATYLFGQHSDGSFCHQYKDDILHKKYKLSLVGDKSNNKNLNKLSKKGIIQEIDLNEELDWVYIDGNTKLRYYY